MRYCPRCGKNTEAETCPDDGTPTVQRAAQSFGPVSKGEIIGGRYRIVDVIGQGGFGTVYEALHTTTGHAVAIKVMLQRPGPEGDQLARRFFQEAATTSRLSHPNTVRVFDFGQTEGGELFIAMERLVGMSLQEILERHVQDGTTVSEAQTIQIGVAVLRSLGEAHALGLVHRDLKPGNIFLHEVAGGDSIVKVLDFGIVKSTDTQMTQAGKALGTPTHMSPEQALGQKIDPRSDLFCLGVVVYECITGSLPFSGDNPLAVVMQHVTTPIEPVLTRSPGCASDATCQVIERALNKDAEKRWADASEMRAALEAATASPQRAQTSRRNRKEVEGLPRSYRPHSQRDPLKEAPATPNKKEASAPSRRSPPASSNPRREVPTQQRPPATKPPSRGQRTTQDQSPPPVPRRRGEPRPTTRPARAVPDRSSRPHPSERPTIPPPPKQPRSAQAPATRHRSRHTPRDPREAISPPSPPSTRSSQKRSTRSFSATPPPQAPTSTPKPAIKHKLGTLSDALDTNAVDERTALDTKAVDERTALDTKAVDERTALDTQARPDYSPPPPIIITHKPPKKTKRPPEKAERPPKKTKRPPEKAERPAEKAERPPEKAERPPKKTASPRSSASPPAPQPPPEPKRPVASPPGGYAQNLFGDSRRIMDANGFRTPAGLGAGQAMNALLTHNLENLARQLKERQLERDGTSAQTEFSISALWLSSSGHEVLLGSQSGQVRWVTMNAIEERPRSALHNIEHRRIGQHRSMVSAVVAQEDSELAITGCVDGWLRAWDSEDGTMIDQLDLDSQITSLAVSSDERLLVAGCKNGRAHLIRLPSLIESRALSAHSAGVSAVASGRSRRLVATGGENGTVRTWDPVGGGARMTRREHEGAVGALALNSDGRLMVSGGWDGRLVLWDTQTNTLLRAISAHDDVIADVALSPNGRFAASASDDRSVRIWQVSNGELIAERTDFQTGVKAVRFEPQSRWVYIGDWEGSIRRLSAIGPL